METPEEPTSINLMMNPDLAGGVWANFARVSHSPYEFTIDFARLEFDGEKPIGGVVVQRVNMSPLFVQQLIDALSENWSQFAQKALPPEAR